MLNKNFALNLSASLSGSPFSFDELILESKELFEREGVPGFIVFFWPLLMSLLLPIGTSSMENSAANLLDSAGPERKIKI